ncbi:carbohydrate-binding module family 13 protein [Rhizophagus irregularis DAOM 181602=DAOM 197198]|nr:carbohydrate-binding module family 13 protein [Rhizophagus irregularis DAOM 181602=DAOM 197198]
MVENIFLPKLSQNFLEILDDHEYYDVTIEVGSDPSVKIFRAHKVILCYRSPYLRRILSTNRTEIDGTLLNIKLSNISPEIFQVILKYIYGGKLTLEGYDTSEIIEILDAASKLSLQELVDYLQSYLIENKPSWIEQNFNLIYQASYKKDSLLQLQEYCSNLLSEEPEKIFKSLDFVSIPEKFLISLIQNDDLKMSEIQIWEHVLRWCHARTPELPLDPSNYSDDDFNTLKIILQKFIPFIRFYNLTSEEFSEKVYPYKKVFSEEFCEDLVKYFLNPNKPKDKSRPRGVISMNIDSKIISNQHAELISKWIDKLDTSKKSSTLHKFELIFRESYDGRRFHKSCNYIPRTVVIIKVKDSDEILGGYNPLEWKSNNGYGDTNDSFIFSFKGNNVENHILSRVKNEERAIYNSILYAPSFGYSDLIIKGALLIEEKTRDKEVHQRRRRYRGRVLSKEARLHSCALLRDKNIGLKKQGWNGIIELSPESITQLEWWIKNLPLKSKYEFHSPIILMKQALQIKKKIYSRRRTTVTALQEIHDKMLCKISVDKMI